MTREELIEFIKVNDRNYNYNKVDFKFYSDEELQMIYKRILRQQKEEEDKRQNKNK
jgi:hypothetical protein